MKPVRSPALREGDAVAVLAPSSSIRQLDRLDEGLDVLRSWGYEVREGRHLRAVHGHLAGVDEVRLADLNQALTDPSVRAVLVGRGGYGAQRIVDAVDWVAVREQPTLLVAYSDLTALLHAAWQRARLVSIHGPSVSRLASLPASSRARLRALLTGEDLPPIRFEHDQVVVGGAASGRLLGGNLAMICAGIGTRDELRLDGDILLIEDVNEAPYELDRMLTQLRRAGILDGAAAVVVASWVGCEAPSDRPSASAAQVTVERLGDLGVPVVVDLPLGHTTEQLALAHGAEAELVTAAGTLRVQTAVA